MKTQAPEQLHQTGFMLLSAVFVLLICATLGVVIVKGVEQSSQSRALNYWSTQSYLYAQSGLALVDVSVELCSSDLSQIEEDLSGLFSEKHSVCALSYACGANNDTVSATVSCSINQDLTVSRIATRQLNLANSSDPF